MTPSEWTDLREAAEAGKADNDEWVKVDPNNLSALLDENERLRKERSEGFRADLRPDQVAFAKKCRDRVEAAESELERVKAALRHIHGNWSDDARFELAAILDGEPK